MPTPTRCAATNKDGSPCQGWATSDSRYCFTHNPEMQVERQAARRLGGFAKRSSPSGKDAPESVRDLEGVYNLLDYALAETVALESSHNRSRVLIALAESYLKAISGQEIDERLTKLEQLLAERNLAK